MPQVVAEAWVPVTPEFAFAVSQTTGEVRLRWDPFIRAQRLIDADTPARTCAPSPTPGSARR